jgi:hypothetical protein
MQKWMSFSNARGCECAASSLRTAAFISGRSLAILGP